MEVLEVLKPLAEKRMDSLKNAVEVSIATDFVESTHNLIKAFCLDGEASFLKEFFAYILSNVEDFSPKVVTNAAFLPFQEKILESTIKEIVAKAMEQDDEGD